MELMIYDKLTKNLNNIVEVRNKVNYHFVNGPWAEVLGNQKGKYTVKFINKRNGNVLFTTELSNNTWAKCNIEYFIDWRIEIWEGNTLFFEHDYTATNKRVYLALSSKALGDTLAWFPYFEEFQKVHNCELIVSTFHNEMLQPQYPNIEFVKPGEAVNGLYAMYNVGLYYNEDGSVNNRKNPNDFKSQTMQKMGSDILGLPYKEIKPKLPPSNVVKDDKLITIAIHGTAQSKYWNNPNGWQEVVNWLNDRGYVVKLLSQENDDYMGNKHPTGIVKHPTGSLDKVMDEMRKSKAFIGIGSGLSWLSWALGTKTVLISGFSYDWAEMQDCIRITSPKDKCGGCFNRLKLDAGDWNWCPDHKGTDRQFECTKSITSQMVINELEKFL
jgi:autotransporter strand-loop-strand O-heptosyltransferase